MDNQAKSIRLEMLADMQCTISKELARVYEATKYRDHMLLLELNKAIEASDKFIEILRAMGRMASLGTPLKFDEQEALLLDQLIRSTEVIDQRNDRQRNVVPFSQKSIDESISYLGLEDPKEGA